MSSIFKWIGIALILSGVLLFIQHTRVLTYSFDGNSFIIKVGAEVPSNHFLAYTDGLGIKKWYYKEHKYERLESPKYVDFPTNVIILECSLILLGFLMVFNLKSHHKVKSGMVFKFFFKRAIMFLVILVSTSYLYYITIITYSKDYAIIFYIIVYIYVIMHLQIWRYIFKTKQLSNWLKLIFHFVLLPFIITNSLQIEIYSHVFEPEALVDRLWIVVAYTSEFIHHWSVQYMVFRLSNLLVIITCIILLFTYYLDIKKLITDK